MARKCCVIGCDDLTKEDIIYFPVPIKPVLYKLWSVALRPVKLTAESLVCHQHFLEDDYQLLRGRHRLKAKVVPSVFGENINNHTESQDNKIEINTETIATQNNNLKTKDTPQRESVNGEPVSEPEKPVSEPEKPVSEPLKPVSEPISEQVNSDLDRQSIDSTDENGLEKCTIECQPEAFLQHDSDSDQDTDLHKEDIEDIIANYHIKQNKHIADRLQQDILQSNEDIPPDIPKKLRVCQNDEGKNDPGKNDSHKNDPGKNYSDKNDPGKNGLDVVHFDDSSATTDSSDLQYIGPEADKAKFIEISVMTGTNKDNDAANDCMMLLEDVQVDIDPTSLILNFEDQVDDKPDPISLLTSSDDDDVIIQEPHIDTVEVSDATDEDDVPLVKLVETKQPMSPPKKKSKNKTLIELRVCELCDFTTSSSSQMSRHKRKHNEKRYKCNLCEYRAMHSMSLIYHMKSHNNINETKIAFIEGDYVILKNCFRCVKCNFKAKTRGEIVRHGKKCSRRTVKFLHACDKCNYKTGRKHDLQRHKARKHDTNCDELDEDYVP